MMAARFQRNISGRSSCRAAGSGERVDFGMRTAGALMPAAAYYFPVTDDYATYSGVGGGTVQALLGKPQGLGHVSMISRRKRWQGLVHCETQYEHSTKKQVFPERSGMMMLDKEG